MDLEKLELFAIVDLFGHQRLAGKVTEQTVGSSTFVRIDVPETKSQPKFSRLVNPTAIYAINPATEEVVNEMAERLCSVPIDSWDIRKMQEKLLLIKSENRPEFFDD